MDQLVSYVVPVVMLLLGLSYLLATELWIRYARELLEAPHRFLVAALGLMTAGLIVVITHNRWHLSLGVVVTVFGWLLVLKGAVFLVFPRTVGKLSGWSEGAMKTALRGGGLVLIVLGALLIWATWFAA